MSFIYDKNLTKETANLKKDVIKINNIVFKKLYLSNFQVN